MIQTVCPTCTLPYWDWSVNHARWQFDRLWSRVGGAKGEAIPNAPFSTWEINVPRTHVPVRWCRVGETTDIFGEPHLAFESSAYLNELISGDNDAVNGFADFSEVLEIAHGAVHVGVGGDMWDGNFSPGDPLFFLHHTFIDYVWSQWQAAGNGNEFDGEHRIPPRTASGQLFGPVSIDDVMAPVQWGRTVREVLENEPSSCVTYAGPGGSVSRVLKNTAERQVKKEEAKMRRDPAEISKAKAVAKEVVKREAAVKKAYDPVAYKGLCKDVIETKNSFYKSGQHIGYERSCLDTIYKKKQKLDSAANSILIEDVENPEVIVERPDAEVQTEGQQKLKVIAEEEM